MKLLAFESADGACSLAYADGAERVLLRNTQIRDSLSWLRAQVETVRARHFGAWAQLDGLVCCTGPGGFTGVRVAVGYAQGLGLATGLPVLGVSSLDAMASQARALSHAAVVWVALDARMGELYAARYLRNPQGRLSRQEPMQLLGPRDLAARLQGEEALLGPGFIAHAAHFPDAEIVPLELDAGGLIEHAQSHVPSENWPSAAALEPVYLRNQVAQTMAQRAAMRQV